MDPIALFYALALFGTSVPRTTALRPVVERAMEWRTFTRAVNRHAHPVTGLTLGPAPTYERLHEMADACTQANGVSGGIGERALDFAYAIFLEHIERLPVTHAPAWDPEAAFAELTDALVPAHVADEELEADLDARLDALIDAALTPKRTPVYVGDEGARLPMGSLPITTE